MIRILLYTAAAVLVMSFFGISIQSVVNSPAGQENIAYVVGLFKSLISFIVTFFMGGLQWIARIFT